MHYEQASPVPLSAAVRRRLPALRRLDARVALIAAACVLGCVAAPAAHADERRHPRAHASVLGGQPASIADWPFVVALAVRGVPLPDAQTCGAAKVAATVLVTAAHCVTSLPGQQLDVVAGSDSLASPAATRIPVARVSVHPRYSELTNAPDVAVVHTTSVVPGTAVALGRRQDSRAGTRVRTAGWGLIAEQPDQPTEALRELSLRVASERRCTAAWKLLFDPVTMVCALPRSSRQPAGACRGDSGGPLVTDSPLKRVVGIVSFGQRCGDPEHPTVYTKVSAVRRFVEAEVRSSRRLTARGGRAARPSRP